MPGVKDWLKKASSDLKASRKLSDDNETLDCSVFHTHQCAEKALKTSCITNRNLVIKKSLSMYRGRTCVGPMLST